MKHAHAHHPALRIVGTILAIILSCSVGQLSASASAQGQAHASGQQAQAGPPGGHRHTFRRHLQSYGPVSIDYNNFSSVAGLTLNGAAAQSGTVLRMTSNATHTYGSAFYSTQAIDITQSFHTNFAFFLHDTSTATRGDGVTFTVQPVGPTALGGEGGGLGYGTINPSVAVEFDTYKNSSDPNNNHVGIDKNGSTTSILTANPAFDMYGSPVNAWVDYDATSKSLQVFVSQGAAKPASPLISTTLDIAATTGGQTAWVGFTGSTGSSSQFNDFQSWHFTGTAGPAPPAGGPISMQETYGGPNPSEPRACDCQKQHADPINTATGNFWETFDDLSIPGRGIPLSASHIYNSRNASQDSGLGYGWTFSPKMALTLFSASAGVTQESGNKVYFSLSNGVYKPLPRVAATLVKNADGTYTFTRRARERFTFSSTGLLTKEQDLNGYTTTLTYNASNQLTTITDPEGRSLTIAYNVGGRVASISDPSNRTVSFAYDASGNLTDVTDVLGRVTHFTYDASHRMLTMTDPRGGVTTNHYDASNRVDWQTDPLNRKTSFAYGPSSTTVTDPNGNVTVETYWNGLLYEETRGYGTARAATWDYSYDLSTLGLTAVTDPNGHLWKETWDANGNLLSRTDPLNRTWTYAYDALNDLTSQTDPSGVSTTLTYDGNGNLLSASRPVTGTAQSATASLTYGDTVHPGDVTKVTDANGHATSYAYNANGDLTSVTDPVGNVTTSTYDGIGRLTSIVSPKGNVIPANPGAFTTSVVYDAADQVTSVTDPLGHQTTYQYDANGNRTAVTDVLGHTTGYTYDAADELTGVTRADNTTQAFGYDPNGNVLTQTDGLNRTTSYAYDPLDRVISRADPLNRTQTYGYDGAGNLTSIVDAMNRTTSYSYDAADKLTGIAHSDGTTPNVSYTYDSLGRRISMTDGTGTSTETYDSLDRLTQSKNGGGQTVGYGYDLGGNLTSLTYPDSSQVTRSFDAADRLTGITDWLQHTTSFAYDANSNLVTQTYPNGTTASSSYDNADQLGQIVDARGGSTLWTFGYGRDNLGQLSTSNDPLDGPSGSQHTYSYDVLNRLTGDQTSTTSSTWSYDAADQLTGISGTTPTTLSYDAASELTTLTKGTAPSLTQNLSFTYNPNGDRTGQSDSVSGTSVSYGYDQEDRLTSFAKSSTSASYSYDGDGLRQSKTVSGTTTSQVWDLAEGLPIIVQDGSTKYITGPTGLPLEQVDGSGNVLYYYQDQLGSTRGLLDGSGNTIATYTYGPYGELESSTGSVSNPFRYAGEYTDPESGLQYLRARYYDPSTMQFPSVDPLVRMTQQAYAYAAGNPLNGVDPFGLVTVQTCISAGAAWGAGYFVQGCYTLAVNDTGAELGFTATFGVGAGTPSAGVTVQAPLVSNANTISDLNGPFGYAGATAGEGLVAGYEGFYGSDPCGRRIMGAGPELGLGARLPVPAEVHAGVSNTWSWVPFHLSF